MQVVGIKTHKVTQEDKNILIILDKYLPEKISENCVIAITSKIIAITEGRIVKIEESNKDELIKQESQYFIPRNKNKYNICVTITNNTFVASAGIDESNSNGYFVLWPQNPQKSANKIREFISEKYKIKNIGVILTDSKTAPLRWGVTAIAIAFSGFEPLVNYIGKDDLFKRKFVFEKMSVIDSLATACSYVMGEGSEQTPIAIATEIPHIIFTGKNPTQEEIDKLRISIDEDLYGEILKNAPWEKGGKP